VAPTLPDAAVDTAVEASWLVSCGLVDASATDCYCRGVSCSMNVLTRLALVRHRLSDRAVRFRVKPIVFAVSFGPAALLFWEALTHQLNVNPYNAIVDTGYWSLRFLCVTIAITPARWLTGWHQLVKFRRMMGLFAFFYGTLHFAAYFVFDCIASVGASAHPTLFDGLARAFGIVGADVEERFFFAIGFAAWALLMPLAITSTTGMIVRLGGRRWRAVHRLVYPAAIASVVHTYWPLTLRMPRYGAILGVVLLLRLARAYARQPAPRHDARNLNEQMT
jgi:methionine sulfoxide reductase heme-binding subunit